MVIMFVGIGFVAVLTGAIAERFLATELAEEDPQPEADTPTPDLLTELRALNERLERLETAVRRQQH